MNLYLFIYTYSLYPTTDKVKTTRRVVQKFFRPTSAQCLCGV